MSEIVFLGKYWYNTGMTMEEFRRPREPGQAALPGESTVTWETTTGERQTACGDDPPATPPLASGSDAAI